MGVDEGNLLVVMGVERYQYTLITSSSYGVEIKENCESGRSIKYRDKLLVSGLFQFVVLLTKKNKTTKTPVVVLLL